MAHPVAVSISTPFILSRAHPDDLLEIAALQYAVYQGPVLSAYIPCSSPADVPPYAAWLQKSLERDSTRVWLKVVDRATGRIIAAALWRIFARAYQELTPAAPMTWLKPKPKTKEESEGSKDMAPVFAEIERNRVEAGNEGMMHLTLCFTDNAYRRRGAGSMLLRWGCDVADVLGVPSWIEASPEGMQLYERFGFEVAHPIVGTPGFAMRRETKFQATEGGMLVTKAPMGI